MSCQVKYIYLEWTFDKYLSIRVKDIHILSKVKDIHLEWTCVMDLSKWVKYIVKGEIYIFRIIDQDLSNRVKYVHIYCQK